MKKEEVTRLTKEETEMLEQDWCCQICGGRHQETKCSERKGKR